MNATTTIGSLGLLTICFTASAPGLAADCAGTNINTRLSWEPTEIHEGTTLATWKAKSVVVSDDKSSPRHLLAGECTGSLLVTADSPMQGSGNCSRKDKDGDVLNEAWTMPAEAGGKGTWQNVGGTGKFSDNTATGTWQQIMSADGSAAIRWEGGC